MKYFKLLAALAIIFTPASIYAQEREGVWVSYIISKKTNIVHGTMQVAFLENGETVPGKYSLRQVKKFIAKDCENGKVGEIKLGKTTKKRRKKNVRQEFEVICEGGPRKSIGKSIGSFVDVYVERQSDGRDLAQYFYSESGKFVRSRRYR